MLWDGPRHAYPGLCPNEGDRRVRTCRKNLWLRGKEEHQEIPSANLLTVISRLVLQVHARVTSPREAPPMEAKANWMPQSKEVAYNIWGALDIDRYCIVTCVVVYLLLLLTCDRKSTYFIVTYHNASTYCSAEQQPFAVMLWGFA